MDQKQPVVKTETIEASRTAAANLGVNIHKGVGTLAGFLFGSAKLLTTSAASLIGGAVTGEPRAVVVPAVSAAPVAVVVLAQPEVEVKPARTRKPN